MSSQRVPLASDAGETRIAAGHTGRQLCGPVGAPLGIGPLLTKEAFPNRAHCISSPRWPTRICTVPSARQFRMTKWCRNRSVEFRYNIPLSPGVYELRLYFADPLRQPDADQKEDAQNYRHFASRPEWPSVAGGFRSSYGRWFGGGGRPGIQGCAPCRGRQGPP